LLLCLYSFPFNNFFSRSSLKKPWRPARQDKLQFERAATGAGAALLLLVCQQQHPLVTDGNEMGINSEFLFLLFMYEINYETMNPVEQIWEVFIWSFYYTWKKFDRGILINWSNHPRLDFVAYIKIISAHTICIRKCSHQWFPSLFFFGN
jgi:hypothetical protein